MKLRNKRVVIIGAGFGGLAVANILAKAGAQVSVFEKNKQPGGRAGFFKAKGFRFDSGPSWYLMPEVFEHYFELLDESVSQWLSLVRLDPAYQALFEDKSSILVQSDRIQTKKSFETIEAGSGQRLTDYLKDAERVYNLAMKHFLYSNFASPKNLVHRDIMRSMPGLISALNLPLDKHVSRYFADPRLKQILEYSMVFLGTSPFEAPSMYRLMSHLDFNQGVFYPKGGIYSLVEALTAIGKKLDVKYHYASPVQRIRTVQGQATGVVLENGQSIDADIVISNADLEYTETALLERGEQTYPAAFWQKKQAAPSAILLYLGISGSLPSLKHHNILFTRDWRANFESIF
jgi:phytoene desaturase